MTWRINPYRCSRCGCDEPIHNAIDGKLYCNNCGMRLENSSVTNRNKTDSAVERVSADECITVLEAAIGEAEYVIPGNVITSAIYYIGEYQRLKIDESWDRCPERMGR